MIVLLEAPAADGGDLARLHADGTVPFFRLLVVEAEPNLDANFTRGRWASEGSDKTDDGREGEGEWKRARLHGQFEGEREQVGSRDCSGLAARLKLARDF